MKAELRLNLCGGEHVLAMPIGGLEEVARLNPRLQVLVRSLQAGDYTLAEVRGVLDVALRWGKATVKADEVIAQEGLLRAGTIAAHALMIAFVSEDERPNWAAVAEMLPRDSAPATA